MNVSTQPTVFGWKPTCWLQVTGSDAATFLQGQFTNDLRDQKVGTTVYGLWLNVKGKIVADSFVLRGSDEEYWIGSYFCPAETVRNRLESHVIADDVTIDDQTGSWSAVSVLGKGAVARVMAAKEKLGLVAATGGASFAGRRSRDESVEWVFPSTSEDQVRAELRDLPEISAPEVERMRIEARIPAIPRDLGSSDLPNEAGLDAEAISYTKGCYLGQEVMARLKSMGQVRRRLLRVSGTVRPPANLPAALFAGTRNVGELRSAVIDGNDGLLGLGMVSLLHVNAETPLSFSADGLPALRLVDQP